jgi:hypothetical protein
MGLPTDSKERKDTPVVRGVLDYFPDAIFAIARLSVLGNDKHNPGQPLHWAKEKSNDHADCAVRHLMERGGWDTDSYPEPVRHSTAAAWRALANLQIEIEEARKLGNAVSRDTKARAFGGYETQEDANMAARENAANAHSQGYLASDQH